MLYAIGDIHGSYTMLVDLIQKIKDHAGNNPIKIVFVGDYVDRGPQSREVINILSGTKPNWSTMEYVCLMGNHERMMLDAFDGSGLSLWLSNGGWATLASYGISRLDSIDIVMDKMQELKKEKMSHFVWMKRLPLYHVHDPYFFVHAGMIPGVPMREQHEGTLLWIRDKFLHMNNPVPGKIIVHGHTPTCFDPKSKKYRDTSGDLVPVIVNGRINIDTGACFFGGRLTAVYLPENGDILDVEILYVEKE